MRLKVLKAESQSRSAQNDFVHVLYAVSDKKGTYAKFLGASMFSCLAHT